MKLSKEQTLRLAAFVVKYPGVAQHDIAMLLNVNPGRVNEALADVKVRDRDARDREDQT